MRRVVTSLIGIVGLLAGLIVFAPVAPAAPEPLTGPSIAAGSFHSVVIGADGRPYATGLNDEGQLTGTGDRSTLTLMTGLHPTASAVAVAAFESQSLVLGSDGVVYGTGSNNYGQLTGTGGRVVLTPLTGLPYGTSAVAVAAGDLHSVVLGSNGRAYGTGWNNLGQLTGTGDKSTLTLMTGLPNYLDVEMIAAGVGHTLVLTSDGTVAGTGRNEAGQLTGSGDKTTLTPMPLPGGVKAVAIAAGGLHSLALGANGKVYGVGWNEWGQLTGTGGDDEADWVELTGLPGGVRPVGIAAGRRTSFVLGSDGKVYGAGSNEQSQLTGPGGTGVKVTTLRPLTGLPAGVRAVEVVGEKEHTLVVGSDGVVYGTGKNDYGQLTRTGNRTTLTPLTQAPAPPRPTGLAAAGEFHSVVIGADGRPYATGLNDEGQLTGTGDKSTLTLMSGLPAAVRATAVAAFESQSLVLGSDGVVYGTGSNNYGQLTGTGDRSTLTLLTGLPPARGAVAIAAGDLHSVVLGSNGRAYGTGWNNLGQLTGTGDRSTLTLLTGLPYGVLAEMIAAGVGHTVVLTSDGLIYGTGRNEAGQLTGSGDKTTLTPMPLPGGVKAVAIAAGGLHSLALGANGKVYGVGWNEWGQLTGTGGDDEADWVELTGLPGGVRPVGIAAGRRTSFVLGSDGKVYGAGSNEQSQLTGPGGTGVKVTTLRPLTGLPAGVRAVEVVGEKEHTLVVGSDGVVYGTGKNDYGQLTRTGNRTTLTPVGPTPVIAGPVRYGAGAVRVNRGGWMPAATGHIYQWRLNGAPIAGATASTYGVKRTDIGKRLTVAVTPRFRGYTGRTVVTAPVTVAKGAPLLWKPKGRPAVKGKKQVGKQLRLVKTTKGRFAPAANKLKFRWLRNGKPIKGKAGKRKKYRVKKVDRGKKLRVRIIAQRPGHANTRVLSKVVRIKKR